MEVISSDPFENMERVINESIAAWSKESFAVNRLLYCENEAVCAALEAAIWVSGAYICIQLIFDLGYLWFCNMYASIFCAA